MKQQHAQKRFRDYGFSVGSLRTGKRNAITDVRGLRVGHYTKIRGSDIRTGITVIDPGAPNLFKQKLPAAIAIGNGYGKLAGYPQVEELGTIEAPIALTNTLAVGPVMRGIVDIVLQHTKDMQPTDSINAVVGECNDGFLNRMHRNALAPHDTATAYANLTADAAVGNVGAGTGTRAFSWKGGIGSASRVVAIGRRAYTLGALLQTNFGGALTILGVPIGSLLGKTDFDSFIPGQSDGSCMIVIATDAPVTSRQLKRIASRAFLGLGRTGSVMSHGSGDYAIAVSVNRSGLEGSGVIGRCLNDTELTPLFLATVETVQESVYDALFAAKTMRGRSGNVLEALPIARVVELLKRYRP